MKFLRILFYIVACLFCAGLLVIALMVAIQTFKLEFSSWDRIALHKNIALGMVAFLFIPLIPAFNKNLGWLMTFSHEVTHMVFAFIFFRKLYGFRVEEDNNYITYSKGFLGNHIISLSPYCIPIFTLTMLPWRFTLESVPLFLGLIDILIGLTFAFHITCWVKQIHLEQTDILNLGIIKSLLLIGTFQILNLCLVLLTPGSGVTIALQRVFWLFPKEFITQVFL